MKKKTDYLIYPLLVALILYVAGYSFFDIQESLITHSKNKAFEERVKSKGHTMQDVEDRKAALSKK